MRRTCYLSRRAGLDGEDEVAGWCGRGGPAYEWSGYGGLA